MINSEKMYLSSAATELSESDTYIELTNRLCYYGEPNLNDVELPIDGAEEKAQTLVNSPVVAKYKIINKKDDLGGHEAFYDPIDKEVKFGTETVGTHVSVEIKDDEVEIKGVKKTLPCLFATSRIWKRNKNIVKAVRRLFAEGKLHTSWEVCANEYSFHDGIKTLTDYFFESNCLLGSTTAPAYPCAETLSLSSMQESQLILAEAVAADFNEEENMAKNDKETSGVEEIVKTENEVLADEKEQVLEVESASKTDTTEDNKEVVAQDDTQDCKSEENKEQSETKEAETELPKVEQSALTDFDLRKKLNRACRDKFDDWCWVSKVFPVEQVCWCEYDGETECDYLLFSYEIVDDDVVVGEPERVRLTVSIAEVNDAISQRDESLLKANETIQQLQSEVDELKPYKDEVEKAEQEKAEQELNDKREKLASYAIKSGHISKQETEEDEVISKMIAELDEQGIKSIIADRFMSSLEIERAECESKHLTSEKQDEITTTNFLNDSDEIKGVSVVSIYLND